MIVFGIGFLLGTIRIFLLLPWIGETAAVALELPVMLLASWMVAGTIVRRQKIPAELGVRAGMGLVAFGCLQAMEVLLSVLVFGNTLADHVTHFTTLAGALGLGGQVMFAAMPLLVTPRP